MASEASNWADHWGAGGIGAMMEDDSTTNKRDASRNKKGGEKNWIRKAIEAAWKGATKSMIQDATSKVKKIFSEKITKKKKYSSE